MMEGLNASRRVTRSHTMMIEAPPGEAFLYLCPVREHEYLEGWSAEMLFCDSGFAEAGCVFSTKRPDDEAKTVWVIDTHDPDQHIVRFVMVTPGSRVGRLKVVCRPGDDAKASAVRFTYEITTIAPAGEVYLDQHFTAEAFEKMMMDYEKAWNHFLRTGEMLRSS